MGNNIKKEEILENLTSLAKQARSNINILNVSQVVNDDGGETCSIAISYEFQYRPKAGAAPHWIKTCDLVNPDLAMSDPEWIRNYVLEQVKKSRAVLED